MKNKSVAVYELTIKFFVVAEDARTRQVIGTGDPGERLKDYVQAQFGAFCKDRGTLQPLSIEVTVE